MLSPVVALLLENLARIGTHLRYCDGGRFPPLTRAIASRMFEDARSGSHPQRTPAGSCPAHGAGRKAALLLKTRAANALKERAAGLTIDVAFDKSAPSAAPLPKSLESRGTGWMSQVGWSSNRLVQH